MRNETHNISPPAGLQGGDHVQKNVENTGRGDPGEACPSQKAGGPVGKSELPSQGQPYFCYPSAWSVPPSSVCGHLGSRDVLQPLTFKLVSTQLNAGVTCRC